MNLLSSPFYENFTKVSEWFCLWAIYFYRSLGIVSGCFFGFPITLNTELLDVRGAAASPYIVSKNNKQNQIKKNKKVHLTIREACSNCFWLIILG